MFNRRPDRTDRAGNWLVLRQVRIQPIELPRLPVGSPANIAVAGFSQIYIRDLLKPTCRIEARRQFVGERLVLDKAVCLCLADGLFVKVHSIERPVLDASNLRPDQCSAVCEVFRAMLSPRLDLTTVCGQ